MCTLGMARNDPLHSACTLVGKINEIVCTMKNALSFEAISPECTLSLLAHCKVSRLAVTFTPEINSQENDANYRRSCCSAALR